MSFGDHLYKPVKALEGLELHYVSDIAIIVMDRGENRVNTPFVRDFMQLLDLVESNPACKGLITIGKGKFFSNGLDRKWMSTLLDETVQEFFGQVTFWILRILLFPIPTLAAINGHAYAAGALLAAAHDLRVQNKEKGWFSFNEVFISLRFHPHQNLFMRTKFGSGHSFTDAIALGKRYTGPEALNDRLVHAITSPSLLLTESIPLLKSFYGKSGYPRESLVLMKTDVYRDAVEQSKKDVAQYNKGENKIVTNNTKSKL